MSTDGIVPLDSSQTSKEEALAPHEGYLHRVAVAVDEMFNVVCDGMPDETISSRAARAAIHHQVWGILLSKGLDKLEPDHGSLAAAADAARAKEVLQTEDSSGLINDTPLG